MAGLVLAALLAGCGGGSHPSQAACKKAMKQEFAVALTAGEQDSEPPQCEGLSAAVLQKLAGQVISGQ